MRTEWRSRYNCFKFDQIPSRMTEKCVGFQQPSLFGVHQFDAVKGTFRRELLAAPDGTMNREQQDASSSGRACRKADPPSQVACRHDTTAACRKCRNQVSANPEIRNWRKSRQRLAALGYRRVDGRRYQLFLRGA